MSSRKVYRSFEDCEDAKHQDSTDAPRPRRRGDRVKPKQPAGPAMTTPSNTPDESERRAQDCRAKAAYCKWVASISPDKVLRQYYAAVGRVGKRSDQVKQKQPPGPPMPLGNMRELGVRAGSGLRCRRWRGRWARAVRWYDTSRLTPWAFLEADCAARSCATCHARRGSCISSHTIPRADYPSKSVSLRSPRGWIVRMCCQSSSARGDTALTAHQPSRLLPQQRSGYLPVRPRPASNCRRKAAA